MRTEVTSKVTVVGYHCWPEAPAEVQFLRDLHRHLFTVEVTVRITKDRGVEFFMLQRDILERLSVFKAGTHQEHHFGYRSCEAIAEYVGVDLQTKHDVVAVTVSEDDENRSTVYFDALEGGEPQP